MSGEMCIFVRWEEALNVCFCQQKFGSIFEKITMICNMYKIEKQQYAF